MKRDSPNESHFYCDPGQSVYIEDIERDEGSGYYTHAQPGDPTGRTGVPYMAHRSAWVGNNGETVPYLIQAYFEYPYYRVFKKVETGWKPCVYYEALVFE